MTDISSYHSVKADHLEFLFSMKLAIEPDDSGDMDILQELSEEQWPELQERIKKLWPINVPGYYTLWFYLKHPNVREAFQFKVYCPDGDINNGFIGISVKETTEVILFPTTQDTTKLEEALVKTKLIAHATVCLDLLTSVTLKSVERIKDVMGLSRCDGGITDMYFLGRDTKPFDQILPANTYAAPVRAEHLHRVNDTWPYKYEGSQYFFTILNRNGLSYGLYSLTHELLAWVFVNDFNFLCHLYCEEEHRKKGYAEYVMKWAVNEHLKQANDVYGYVLVNNEKPVKLFKKLGFQVVDVGGYLYVQKFSKDATMY